MFISKNIYLCLFQTFLCYSITLLAVFFGILSPLLNKDTSVTEQLKLGAKPLTLTCSAPVLIISPDIMIGNFRLYQDFSTNIKIPYFESR